MRENKYYTLRDVERITDRTYWTIRRWVKSGQFPPWIKITDNVRSPLIWERETVDKFLIARTQLMRFRSI